MTENEAIQAAEPILRKVVDLIAENNYDALPDHVGFKYNYENVLEDIKNAIEEFKSDAEVPYMDKFDVPCKNADFERIWAYIFNNGKGFSIDYNFTTDGEINDLTLQMDFLFGENNEIKPYIADCHVL